MSSRGRDDEKTSVRVRLIADATEVDESKDGGNDENVSDHPLMREYDGRLTQFVTHS